MECSRPSHQHLPRDWRVLTAGRRKCVQISLEDDKITIDADKTSLTERNGRAWDFNVLTCCS